MKKVLLSAALFASVCANAQITSSSNSYKIDFTGLDPVNEAPLIPLTAGWGPDCEAGSGNSYTAEIKDGSLQVTTTGKQMDYYKMEVGLVDNFGLPTTVDFTALKDRGIEVELETTNSNFEFMVLLADDASVDCTPNGWQVVADDVPALKVQVGEAGTKTWSNRNDDLSLNDEAEGGFSFKVFENFTFKKEGCYDPEGEYIDSTAIDAVWLYFRVAPAYQYVISNGDTTAQIELNNGCDGSNGKSIAGTFKVKSIYLGELAPEPLQATVSGGSGALIYDIDFAGKSGAANTLVSNSRYTECTTDPTIKAQEVVNGALEFITSGDQEQWHHAEMKIVDAQGQPTTIDLSDAARIKFDVESNVAVEEFMVLFADDVTKNCYKSPIEQVAADNNPAIKGSLSVGAQVISNDNDAIDGNDPGAGAFDFSVFQTPCMKDQSCGADVSIDKTKISELWIYARKTVAEPSVCVLDEPTENCGKSVAATIKIKKITIEKPVGLEEFVSTEATFSVFPNPVSEGVINFSEELELVELYNTQGNLVKTGVNTNELNVDGLSAGIYVVQSNKGYKRVVIK